MYKCDDWSSQVDPSSRRLVADYSLRLARAAAAEQDTARLRELMVPYGAEDWSALERIAVEHACSNAMLAAYVPRFPEPGTMAPEFDLRTLQGGTPIALKSFRGRIVVVDFWSTWCVPCLNQMPQLADVARTYPDRVAVVAIVHKDSPELVADWLTRSPTNPLIHLLDPGEDVARAFGVRGIPATFVVGPDGAMMAAHDNPRIRMHFRDLAEYLKASS
jgi:thiol-disulfide isomerase/thioredoxin